VRTVVRYHGVPKPLVLLPFNAPIGWLRTNDGAAVAAEPDAASTWFPSNDHPSDKASFTFVVNAPSTYTSVANGLPSGSVTAGGRTTTTWQAPDPMATYLATVALGKFKINRYTTAGGIPVLDAVAAGVGKDADNALAAFPRILDYEQSVFGKYPFSSAGNTVVDAFLGFALENQTRPVYDRGFFAPGNNPFELGVVVHEYAHMWFGDSVAVRRWQDIWLNEGFATYAEWLWSGHEGDGTPEQIYQSLICLPPSVTVLWNPKPGDPGKSQLFAQSVYTRGAMTLQALRKAIGDQAFFTVLRRWAATNQDGLGTTEKFIGLAQGVSGKKLQPLFDTWLFTPGKPAGLPTTCPQAGAAERSALVERFGRPTVVH
jgi:aminopeptidase N